MPDELRRTLRSATYRASGAEVIAALQGADIRPHLQLAGDGVITAQHQGIEKAPQIAERFATELRARDWDGDQELANELDAAIGLGEPTPLADLPTSLDELAELLDDGQGEGGAIHLPDGAVWPNVAIEYNAESGDDDESDDIDAWLPVHSAGSRAAYGDMEQFIATVDSADMAERLQIAVRGRGAFSRFRATLQQDEVLVSRWAAFSEERRLGRARAWLADAGYSPRTPYLTESTR